MICRTDFIIILKARIITVINLVYWNPQCYNTFFKKAFLVATMEPFKRIVLRVSEQRARYRQDLWTEGITATASGERRAESGERRAKSATQLNNWFMDLARYPTNAMYFPFVVIMYSPQCKENVYLELAWIAVDLQIIKCSLIKIHLYSTRLNQTPM